MAADNRLGVTAAMSIPNTMSGYLICPPCDHIGCSLIVTVPSVFAADCVLP